MVGWIQVEGRILTVMRIARVLPRDAPELTLEIDGHDVGHLRPMDALHGVVDLIAGGRGVAV